MKKLVLIVIAFAFVSTAMGGQFPDVRDTHWAYSSVEVLVNAGIFDGADGKLYCTEGEFHGRELLNRYQMAIIVAKILKITDSIAGAPKNSAQLTDVPEAHVLHDAIQSAVDSGILKEFDGKFYGKRLLNRYQIALILARILTVNGIRIDLPESPQFTDLDQSHWAYDAILRVVEAELLQGYDGKFHGKRLLNRYQMAVIIAKLLAKLKKSH